MKNVGNTKESDTPLKCWVEGKQLVIRIGIGTLAWAAKKNNGGPLEGRFKVCDKEQFAKDVANAFLHQDEVGNSWLAECLDSAIVKAVESGSTGLEYPK